MRELIIKSREEFAREIIKSHEGVISRAISECFNIDYNDVELFVRKSNCQKVVHLDKSEVYVINGLEVIRMLPPVTSFNNDGFEYKATSSTSYELMYKESNDFNEEQNNG